MSKRNRGIGLYIIILLIFIGTSASLLNASKQKVVVYSDVVRLFEEQQVKNFSISGTTITMELRDSAGTVVKTSIPSLDVFLYDLGDTIKAQRSAGIIENQIYQEESGSILMLFLPYIVIIVLFGAFWFFIISKQQGGGAGAGGQRIPPLL